MKKSTRTWLVLAVFLSLPALAYGGLGVGAEYSTNIGADLLPAPPGSALQSLPSGSITQLSGFGYWINPGGWRIGGFLMVLIAGNIGLSVPYSGQPVTSANAGCIGVLSGGQGRLGPFRLSLNLRAGFGGATLGYTDQTTGMPDAVDVGFLFAAADGEVGLLLVPAMLVSVYAGVEGILFAVSENPASSAAALVAGVRIAWGSF